MSVYFAISAKTGLVKIGTSKNVKKRVSCLQSMEGAKLFVVRKIPGSYAEEAWAHHKFKDRRVRGEWFRYCAEMMTFEVPDNFLEELTDARRDASTGRCIVSFNDDEFSEIAQHAYRAGFGNVATFIRFSALRLANEKGFWK